MPAQRISQLAAAAALVGTELMEVSQLSTTVTLTAVDLSALAADNSINSVAAAFVTAGFVVGMAVKVTGFTGNVANNIVSGVLTAVTAGKLTFGGTDGDVIVDDAAGESVTITAWVSVRSTAQAVAALASGNVAVAARYTLDLASQVDGDPGLGKLRFNNASPVLATKIFLDDETSDGVDMSTALLDLGGSGYLRIQAAADVGEWLYAKWTAIVDDTGYFDLTISVLAAKGTLDDTDALLVTFDAKGSGGGSAQGRHAIFIAAGSMAPSITGGCATLARIASAANQPDIASLDFDTTTQEYAQFYLTMPKSWNEGTVTFAPVWSHAATTVNFGVVFDLQAVAVSDLDPIAVAYGTAVTSTDTGATTNTLYMGPESAAMTVAGTPANEDTVFFRVSRVVANAGDTMAIDARLMGIVLYITTNADTDA